MSSDLVVAITGASGSIYGVRLLEVLLAAGRRVHLVISPAGRLAGWPTGRLLFPLADWDTR